MSQKKTNFLRFFILFFWWNLLSIPASGFQIADTLQNYFELKLYSGDADTVWVNHPRYHGLFQRDTCTTEDHGTTILANSGCWKRISPNFSPRYWAIGGFAPDFLIGPRVTSETDAINSAAYAAALVGGDTIEIDSLYLIDRSIYLFTNNTYLGTADGTGFKRIDPPVTILTDTAHVDDKQIKVVDNTGFKKRHQINIARAINFDSLAGFVSYNAAINRSVGGDTIIYLSGLGIQRQMLPGDSVSLFFPMMTPRTTPIDTIRLERLTFNGNREKYNLNYDWRVSPTLLIPTTNFMVISNCHFAEIPNENAFLCGADFIDCTGTDLNGSVLHFSCNDFDHPTNVLYNNFSNTNQVGNDIMKHSEAGFTFSARVQNLRVAYNRLDNMAEYGLGIFRNDDQSNEITDNLFDAPLGSVEIGAFYLYPETNLIYNNKNPNFTDTSTTSCWLSPPQLSVPFACQGSSSFTSPLVVGDSIRITLDSFLWKNSNVNFVKAILPAYTETYFTLVDMHLNVAKISSFHKWIFTEYTAENKGLIFDNGHRDGLMALGNWGYELCGESENCSDLEMIFVVRELPDSTGQIPCPLLGMDIIYDGEMGGWDTSILCKKNTVTFDTLSLGNPFLLGDPVTKVGEEVASAQFDLYPNPCREYFQIDLPANTRFQYQLINALGNVVKQGVIDNQPVFVNNLAKGVFHLRIFLGNQIYFTSLAKL